MPGGSPPTGWRAPFVYLRNRITAILRRERPVTAETAERLGRYLGTGPEFWMALQTACDIDAVNREKGA